MRTGISNCESVYRYHQGYASCVRSTTTELMSDYGVTVEFILTEDGSGVGAALIAAIA